MKELISKLGDNTFNFIYLAISAILVYISFVYGISYLQIISIALVKVGIYTFTSTWLVRFLNGLNCNIYEEIFEKQNIAAALLVSGLLLGLSIVIAIAV